MANINTQSALFSLQAAANIVGEGVITNICAYDQSSQTYGFQIVQEQVDLQSVDWQPLSVTARGRPHKKLEEGLKGSLLVYAYAGAIVLSILGYLPVVNTVRAIIGKDGGQKEMSGASAASTGAIYAAFWTGMASGAILPALLAGALVVLSGSLALQRLALSSRNNTPDPTQEFLNDNSENAVSLEERIKTHENLEKAVSLLEGSLRADPELLHFLGYQNPEDVNVAGELAELSIVEGELKNIVGKQSAFYNPVHNAMAMHEEAFPEVIAHELLHALHFKRMYAGITREVIQKISEKCHRKGVAEPALIVVDDFLAAKDDSQPVPRHVRDAAFSLLLVQDPMKATAIYEAVADSYRLQHSKRLKNWYYRIIARPLLHARTWLALTLSGRKRFNQKYHHNYGTISESFRRRVMKKGLFASMLG